MKFLAIIFALFLSISCTTTPKLSNKKVETSWSLYYIYEDETLPTEHVIVKNSTVNPEDFSYDSFPSVFRLSGKLGEIICNVGPIWDVSIGEALSHKRSMSCHLVVGDIPLIQGGNVVGYIATSATPRYTMVSSSTGHFSSSIKKGQVVEESECAKVELTLYDRGGEHFSNLGSVVALLCPIGRTVDK